MTRAPSGRPRYGEYASYARPDVDAVVGDDAVAALTAQGRDIVALLEGVAEAAARGLTYAPGKWTRHSGFEERPLADVLAEYRAVRQATLAFFAGLPAEAWLRSGTVNDYPATVRGLAFHIAGHELRHLRALREKYLVLPSSREQK